MAKDEKGKITVRQLKGLRGCTDKQRACVVGLGLRGRHKERTLENTPAVRGMIKKVLHLVEVISES